MLTVRYYQPGEIIFRENDAGDTAYVIERGRVVVSKAVEGRPVHLATLGVGELFGEMSMIDDKPRSATVTALESTVVREIPREDFFESCQTHPKIAINILQVIFERLREADATILQLRHLIAERLGETALPPLVPTPRIDVIVYLEGLTAAAAQALPVTPFPITKFPFRIGQASQDPLAHNDLMLPDVSPPQLSRHHVSVIQYAGYIGVADRGSQRGALVDGQRLGGEEGNPGPLFFEGSEGELVLGDADSPYRYRVVIRSQK
jgi:CRP-like cAMP-binding protein